jgi:hypothetical protein
MRRDANSPLKPKVLPDDQDEMPCDTAPHNRGALRHFVAQPEGVRHRLGVPLQFTQFVAADEQAVPG